MINFRRSTTHLLGVVLLVTVTCVAALGQDAAKATGRGDSATNAAPEVDVHTAPADPAQAQLVADTEKLSKLTKELRAELAKSNKDTLSLAVVKKAEEVEKLARSLKERMNKTQ